ncbi:Fibropellin-1 [Exaiptasia diaphana]|nr:Fibropellin-1 [Exaiptasia diaphana]
MRPVSIGFDWSKFDFDIKFTRASAEDYVKISRPVPSMTAITLCVWLKTVDKRKASSVISYAVLGSTNEVLLNEPKSLLFWIGSSVWNTRLNVADGEWHHICGTWENSGGQALIYKDGQQAAKHAFKKGHVIKPNGALIIGQEQDSVGGGFQSTQNFIGELSGINIWNKVIRADEIKIMAIDYRANAAGNVLQWSDVFCEKKLGQTKIIKPTTSCKFINASAGWRVLFDFENDGLSKWTLTGTAFNNQPTYGDNPTARKREPSNHKGNWWIGGAENRPSPSDKAGAVQLDKPTGTMKSPPFRLTGTRLKFLISGGCGSSNKYSIYAGLYVRSGFYSRRILVTRPLRCSETMVEKEWSIQSHYLGSMAQVILVDSSTKGWGHINFDHLMMYEPPPVWTKLYDFEKGKDSLSTWTLTGTAFSNQPTYGDNPTARKKEPSNHKGNWWIGGAENRPSPSDKAGAVQLDKPQGNLTSPSFLITGYKLRFLIGGGCDSNVVRLELEVDEEIVAMATGKCLETMVTSEWDVSCYLGKLAKVRAVDQSSTGWGHINFDNIEIPSLPVEVRINKMKAVQLLIVLVMTFAPAMAFPWISSPAVNENNGPERRTIPELQGNPCISSPCLNNARCIGSDWSFTCDCPSGYTGDHCETDIDDCAKNPCQNGKCIDGINSYKCDCVAGYSGKNCENNVDECADGPCKNGAKCIDGVNAYKCECAPGFNRKNCENNVDECAKKPCQNGAECIDGVNSYECKCKLGYNGKNCENSPVCNKVRRIGCFNSYSWVVKKKTLPKMILTDRDKGSPVSSDKDVDWVNWGHYMADIACRCSERAKLLGYKIIGIQNFGECWSGPSAKAEDFGPKIASSKCVGIDYKNCLPGEKHCVGLDYTNFVYELVPPTPFSRTVKGRITSSKFYASFLNTLESPLEEAFVLQTALITKPFPKPRLSFTHANTFRLKDVSQGFDLYSGDQPCDRNNADDCVPNPCTNGKCIDGVNSYTCECIPGYAGKNCQTDVDECAKKPCQNGAKCIDGVNAYKCECAPGFNGKNCENNVDECAKKPCQNGGKCTDGVNSYTCKCAAGYTGPNCETNADDCVPNPCTNGKCIDGVNSYTCECIPGYAGKNCQTDVDECAKKPCQNGAKCIDGVNAYKCECAPGFNGKNCENNVDECAKKPCQNGGKCTDGVNSYTCKCAAGYTGPNCETSNVCPKFERHGCFKARDGKSGQAVLPKMLFSDRLKRSPEFNSRKGVNWKGWNDYLQDIACRCAEEAKKVENAQYFAIQFFGECWSGSLADVDLDSLASNKCYGRDYKTCSSDSVDKYCVGGANNIFIYRFDNVDECAKKPCQNGAQCIDGVNSYTCKCAAGFTGPNCETNVDECAKKPCQNGAECIDGVNSYECKCKLGYTGKNCENSPVCHKVKRVGCFKSFLGWHRSLPDLILTDRDEKSPQTSGLTMPDWDNWGHYMADIACRCAELAKKSGYKFIGIEYYGECWGSLSVKADHFRPGIASSSCGGIDYVKCLPEEKHCVGLQFGDFVYEIGEW